VSVIVPTYRRPDALRATLEALVAVEHPTELMEVVVVDDGAEAATEAVVERSARDGFRIRYASQEQRGAASARNLGAQLATGNVLVFLDDDMLVEPDHIAQHLATRARYGDCLVNGHWEFTPETIAALEETPFGRFRMAVERWYKDGIAKTPLDGSCVEPAEMTACNLSVRRELFLELGGFDEEIPFAGAEDVEFSYRAAQAGCRFVYNPEIRLLHNDRRVTLRQFGTRHMRGAMTAVYLAAKHPERYAHRPLIRENAPVSRTDPFRLIVKKSVKRLLSSSAAIAALLAVVDRWERRKPQSRALPRVYWAMCGLYIFRGIREGLKLVELPPAEGELRRSDAT